MNNHLMIRIFEVVDKWHSTKMTTQELYDSITMILIAGVVDHSISCDQLNKVLRIVNQMVAPVDGASPISAFKDKIKDTLDNTSRKEWPAI